MLTNLTGGILAFLAFIAFPFLLISAAAMVLVLLDHFAYLFRHHDHNHGI